MHRFFPHGAAVLLALASLPAAAASLVRFTDQSPQTGTAAPLSDTGFNVAVSWSQSAATSNVTLSALLTTNVGPTTGNWYVTTALGSAATAADVLYSGTYGVTHPEIVLSDFNGVPRTPLASGLAFAAGTYFLVLDGPAGDLLNNANWQGDGDTRVDLAAGFALRDTYLTRTTAGFAPAGDFFALDPSIRFVFEMETSGPVPLPGSLLLAATALALLRQR